MFITISLLALYTKLEQAPCLTHIGREGDLRQLVSWHESGHLSLRVVAVSASERTLAGSYLTDFDVFVQRLQSAGLGSVEILRPIGYYGMAYYGHFIYGGEQEFELEHAIHDVLFPNIERTNEDYCKARGLDPEHIDRRWRNAKCDVIALWGHIYYHGDVFVTGDGNFLADTKLPRLLELGAGAVVAPAKAVMLVERRLAASGDR